MNTQPLICTTRPSTDSRPEFIVPECREQVDILYADDSCLLIAKPSGLLSVPGRHPANRDCAITRVQQQYPDALIVHRLDMDTSGLMVLARGKEAHRRLSQQFQARTVEKHYQARVHGLVKEDHGTISLPLRCDWPNRPKQMVDHQQGKAAHTEYRVLERDNTSNSTRLRLTPVTGRSHQLRVHSAELGHPILGCSFYGTEQSKAAAPRLQLHACFLKLQHPVTGEPLQGESAVPF